MHLHQSGPVDFELCFIDHDGPTRPVDDSDPHVAEVEAVAREYRPPRHAEIDPYGPRVLPCRRTGKSAPDSDHEGHRGSEALGHTDCSALTHLRWNSPLCGALGYTLDAAT